MENQGFRFLVQNKISQVACFFLLTEKPSYRMIYMEDPFGSIVEIYSHSYELIYSDGAY